jgi:redox-sensing transcriptional repressor
VRSYRDFDRNPELHGKYVTGQRDGMTPEKSLYKIRSMSELPAFCKEKKPKIAVLCVPKSSAKAVCEELIEIGVKNFWNFTHFDINILFADRDDVNVENVHLGDSLLTLVYRLNRQNK